MFTTRPFWIRKNPSSNKILKRRKAHKANSKLLCGLRRNTYALVNIERGRIEKKSECRANRGWDEESDCWNATSMRSLHLQRWMTPNLCLLYPHTHRRTVYRRLHGEFVRGMQREYFLFLCWRLSGLWGCFCQWFSLVEGWVVWWVVWI